MSLVNEGNGKYMPVAPAYNGGGYGTNGFGWGDGAFWIIILFLFASAINVQNANLVISRVA